MKKLIALLLALLMLGAVAFAEEEATTTTPIDEVLDFDIVMDKLPEGYTV